MDVKTPRDLVGLESSRGPEVVLDVTTDTPYVSLTDLGLEVAL